MNITTDHQKIKQWIKKNKGVPEIIDDPDARADKIGIRVRFMIPGDKFYIDEKLHHETSWDMFFRVFEEQQLAFEHNNEVSLTDPSLSYRFLKREILETKEFSYL